MSSESLRHSRRSRTCWLSAAFAIGALSACSAGSTPPARTAAASSGSTGTSGARAGDPAADDRVRASAIANGIVTPHKACDLLTRPDAEAAVGQPLPKNTVNLTLGMCDYNADDFSAGASLTVSSWESVKNAAGSGRTLPEPISGVGDEALNLRGANGSVFYVRKGSDGFLLTLNGPKIDRLPDHGLAAEKALAVRILARF